MKGRLITILKLMETSLILKNIRFNVCVHVHLFCMVFTEVIFQIMVFWVVTPALRRNVLPDIQG
jgi:hypothetical protein